MLVDNRLLFSLLFSDNCVCVGGGGGGGRQDFDVGGQS